MAQLPFDGKALLKAKAQFHNLAEVRLSNKKPQFSYISRSQAQYISWRDI
jgi:hypothetical protein